MASWERAGTSDAVLRSTVARHRRPGHRHLRAARSNASATRCFSGARASTWPVTMTAVGAAGRRLAGEDPALVAPLMVLPPRRPAALATSGGRAASGCACTGSTPRSSVPCATGRGRGAGRAVARRDLDQVVDRHRHRRAAGKGVGAGDGPQLLVRVGDDPPKSEHPRPRRAPQGLCDGTDTVSSRRHFKVNWELGACEKLAAPTGTAAGRRARMPRPSTASPRSTAARGSTIAMSSRAAGPPGLGGQPRARGRPPAPRGRASLRRLKRWPKTS